MKKIHITGKACNEYDEPVAEISLALAGSFMRFGSSEEHVIHKLDIFIDRLKLGKPFELDEADLKMFRNIVLACDAAQIVKSPVLKILDN